MKKLITLFFIIYSIAAFSQEFSFNIYVKDAKGNIDSVIVGFDINGTDSIDAIFGEQNIINNSWDSVLEFRISEPDYVYNIVSSNYNPEYQSKKQIIYYNTSDCDSIPNPWTVHYCNVVILALKVKYPPFKVYWDSTLFQDSCFINSGFWYVLSADFIIPANRYSFFTIFQPITYFEYFTQGNDTIWPFVFNFSEYSTIGMEQKQTESKTFNIYPVPAENDIKIELDFINTKDTQYQIFNQIGKLINHRQINAGEKNIIIDISDYSQGLYFFRLYNENLENQVGKFMKL